MAPLLRKALGAFKDQTSIGLAKVASSRAPDLDVALVKATSHDELPTQEKHFHDILRLSSCSRAYVHACVSGLAKRLWKTRNWIVALKSLMLAHRLLLEGDPTFEQELLLAGRRGVRVLNVSDFRDESSASGWDYSAFVRSYGLYLNERLDCPPGGKPPGGRSGFNERRSGYEEHESYNGYGSAPDYGDRRQEDSRHSQKSNAVKDMKAPELLEKLPDLHRLLERAMACRPAGAAKGHRLIQISLYTIVRDSFQIYADICDGLNIVLDAFFEMEQQDCARAFHIYTRAATQVEELASFYSFCKSLGICRPSEYPALQPISEELLRTLQEFMNDRFQTSSRDHRQRSPEPKPTRSSEREAEAVDEASYEVNGMKALPAPPTAPVNSQMEASSLHKQDSEADLLNLDNATISSEEHGDRLALALFSGSESAANRSWQPFSSPEVQGHDNGTAFTNQSTSSNGGVALGEEGAAGWELALVASASQLPKYNSNTMAGGFDRLLLDSMYDQATERQKTSAAAPVGSASSVALPGRSASSFLALPAPVAQAGEDPFAASLNIPAPSYVQMAELTQRQQLLVQEQQLWLQYQTDGMQGYTGLMKYYNTPYNTSFQAAYSVPYYGTGGRASY